MAEGKRNIGREILEGLRVIKSGRHGRVVNHPSVASIREKTGLSQEIVLQHCLVYRDTEQCFQIALSDQKQHASGT